MFNFFKKTEPITIDAMTFHYENGDWCTEISFQTKSIELCLDGNKKGVYPFAQKYWFEINDGIEALWSQAIEFTLLKLHELNEYSFKYEDFVLSMICIHRENAFDGGHLALWFEIKGDNGIHYVSFRNKKPYYWHRDS